MIKAVIFDLGNVLVLGNNSKTLSQFAPFLQRPYSDEVLEVTLYGYSSKAKHWETQGERTKTLEAYQLGLLSTRQFYEYMRDQLRFSDELTFDQFKHIWPARFSRYTETLTLLKRLNHLQRYMLSDTNALDTFWIQHAFPDIFVHFNKLFLSYKTHVNKYSFEAWHNILNYSHLLPEEHLFIDDREEHVVRAQRLGLKGIVFCGSKQLEKELIAFGCFKKRSF